MLGGGHRTLSWPATPTVSAEGRRRKLQAIHAPPITTSTVPKGTSAGCSRGQSSARKRDSSNEHVRGTPEGSGPPGQRPRAPDRYPEERIAHEGEHDDQQAA
jgi:hypothetical protein